MTAFGLIVLMLGVGFLGSIGYFIAWLYLSNVCANNKSGEAAVLQEKGGDEGEKLLEAKEADDGGVEKLLKAEEAVPDGKKVEKLLKAEEASSTASVASTPKEDEANDEKSRLEDKIEEESDRLDEKQNEDESGKSSLDEKPVEEEQIETIVPTNQASVHQPKVRQVPVIMDEKTPVEEEQIETIGPTNQASVHQPKVRQVPVIMDEKPVEEEIIMPTNQGSVHQARVHQEPIIMDEKPIEEEIIVPTNQASVHQKVHSQEPIIMEKTSIPKTSSDASKEVRVPVVEPIIVAKKAYLCGEDEEDKSLEAEAQGLLSDAIKYDDLTCTKTLVFQGGVDHPNTNKVIKEYESVIERYEKVIDKVKEAHEMDQNEGILRKVQDQARERLNQIESKFQTLQKPTSTPKSSNENLVEEEEEENDRNTTATTDSSEEPRDFPGYEIRKDTEV